MHLRAWAKFSFLKIEGPVPKCFPKNIPYQIKWNTGSHCCSIGCGVSVAAVWASVCPEDRSGCSDRSGEFAIAPCGHFLSKGTNQKIFRLLLALADAFFLFITFLFKGLAFGCDLAIQ